MQNQSAVFHKDQLVVGLCALNVKWLELPMWAPGSRRNTVTAVLSPHIKCMCRHWFLRITYTKKSSSFDGTWQAWINSCVSVSVSLFPLQTLHLDGLYHLRTSQDEEAECLCVEIIIFPLLHLIWMLLYKNLFSAHMQHSTVSCYTIYITCLFLNKVIL